jgi:hypothetical protein
MGHSWASARLRNRREKWNGCWALWAELRE